MNPYQWFKDQTAKLPRTDIWRAVIGLLAVIVLLWLVFGLAGCTSTGPSVTGGVGHRGEGFIRVRQNLNEWGGGHVCFVEYEHHSEILKEEDEVVFDGGIVGCTVQFGDWPGIFGKK